MSYHDQLKELLFKHSIKVLGKGETMTLASGKVIGEGNYYADLRLLTTLPTGLYNLTESVIWKLPKEISFLGAVPTGGMTTLGAIGYAMGMNDGDNDLKLFYVRKEKKDHGSEKMVEGHLDGSAPAAMFEDVATTGKSLIEAIQTARAERNANIIQAVCVLDREMGAKEALAAIGVELVSIFTATELGLKKPG